MGWPGAGPRLAVTLRRLRGRFGIAAPRVAVRTHISWHWRVLAVTFMAAAAIALALWIYDAGRRFAGFDSNVSAQELVALKNRLAELEADLARARQLAASADSSLQIERTTQQQLVQQVRVLEGENARIKEDLAGFEQLSTVDSPAGTLTISHFRVRPAGVPGQYRYTLLAAIRQPQKSQEFNGMLKLLVTLQRDGRDVMIELPAESDASVGQFKVVIRHFRKIEGEFTVPLGAVLRKVEARIQQSGVTRASRQATL